MLKTIRMITGTHRGRWMNKAMVYTCVEMLFIAAPYSLLYWVIKNLFEGMISWKQTALWTLLLFLFFVMQLLFSTLAQIQVQNGGSTEIQQLRMRFGEHLRKLPMGFFKRRNQGDISQTLLTNVDEVEMVLTHILPHAIGMIMLSLFYSTLLLFIDWRLALIVFISIPLAMPLFFWSQKVMNERSRKRHEAFAEASGKLLEFIENIQLLKAHRLVGKNFKKLDQAMVRFRDDSIRVEAAASPVLYLYAVALETGFLFLLFAGSYLLLAGKLDAPVLFLFFIISVQFYKPLRAIGTYLSQLRYMVNAGERIKEVFAEAPLPEPKSPKHPTSYQLELNHVYFQYDGDPVLKDVSFSVPERGIVALVGPSGSGKSTILSLIARFWDVDQGAIRIGGFDIRELRSEDLLHLISFVFQDVHLFNGTILENIRIGRQEASFAQVVEAASLAQCHSFIEKLPQGYNTIVGAGGVHLSGGEKQRISIARALLKDAPILLLDEITASLDPENERLIQRAISQLAKKKTVMMIAHRLKTIQAADQIIVLDQGEVIEQGTHSDLYDKQGIYYKLWQEQQKAGGWKLKHSSNIGC